MQWRRRHTEVMEEHGRQVNWRIAILSAKGEPHIFGRLSLLSRDKVEATIPHGLLPDSLCQLVVMLPRSDTDVARRVIEGRCQVSASRPAAGQFHVVLEWQEMAEESMGLLQACLE